MDNIKEMMAELKECLTHRSVSKEMQPVYRRLAECLEEIPVDKLSAIYEMMSNAQFGRRQKAVIAMQVCEDVSAVLEGKDVVFSKPFLTEPA